MNSTRSRDKSSERYSPRPPSPEFLEAARQLYSANEELLKLNPANKDALLRQQQKLSSVLSPQRAPDQQQNPQTPQKPE